MNKCIIFLSNKENYLGSALKIKEESDYPVDIIYIEEFIKHVNILQDSVIYFLCNSNLVTTVLELKELKNCYIFNENFFKNNYSKLKLQNVLKNNCINIPKFTDKNGLNKINFPIFLKENKHGGIVLQLYNLNTILKCFEKFNEEELYLEETIISKKEFKIYYINNSIYSKVNINNTIKLICIKVAKCLQLNIFSLDILQDMKDQYYVIDVNPSAGFYMLDCARKELINNIEKIIKKGEK